MSSWLSTVAFGSASPMEDAIRAEIDSHPTLMLHPEVVGVACAGELGLEILNDPDLETLVEDAMVVKPRNKQKYEQRSVALMNYVVESSELIVGVRKGERELLGKKHRKGSSQSSNFA